MKLFAGAIVRFLGAIILGAFVLSCDDLVNVHGIDPPPVDPGEPSANDPKCLSVTGNRYEKYYYQLDQASYNTNITLSSPSVLGYQYGSGANPVSYGFNRIVLADLPLKRFTENTSFTHQVSGTLAVSGKSGSLSTAYSMPFEKSALLSPYRNYNNLEPFNVLNSFANTPGDLVLAYTGDYSSLAKKEDLRVFSMTFSSEFLKSCKNTDTFVIPFGPSGADTEFTVDGVYPCDLTATGSAYVSLIPVKRNFYQYRNLTATFSPGFVITDIKTTSIVKDYDYNPTLNSLSIVFNDYDFPYIGDVLFYKIGAGDDNTQSKAIRIEG